MEVAVIYKRQNSWQRLDSCRSLGPRVDEVKVFETFGGDLPASMSAVKLESKNDRATGLTRFQHHAWPKYDLIGTNL